MAKDVLDVQIRDTTSHTASLLHNEDNSVLQYVNTLDQSVTIVVNGTYTGDNTFSDAHQINSQSVNAGKTASLALTEPWDRLQVDVSAGTAPTSGSVLVKKHD